MHALGPGANTDTKLLICCLFQKGRILAQDGVAARQIAQREQPRHETDLDVGFAHADELPHLVELREVPRLAASGHVDAGQGEGEIADWNKPAAFLLLVCAHRHQPAYLDGGRRAQDPSR